MATRSSSRRSDPNLHVAVLVLHDTRHGHPQGRTGSRSARVDRRRTSARFSTGDWTFSEVGGEEPVLDDEGCVDLFRDTPGDLLGIPSEEDAPAW